MVCQFFVYIDYLLCSMEFASLTSYENLFCPSPDFCNGSLAIPLQRPLFSPKYQNHRNVSLVIYLPILYFSFCQKPLYTFVVYFDQLLGAACTQKLVELPFSAVLIFSVHLTPFLVVSQLKSTKNVWKWTKKLIFVYSSKLVDKQKQVDSLRGYLEFVIFWLIFYNWNQSKRVTIWSSNIQITGALYDGHFQFEFY